MLTIEMTTRTEKRLGWSLGLAVGLALLLAYAPRVAPGLLGGDAGEFQMAAWLGGLAHPTGYPLYLLLGWLWTHGLAVAGVEPASAMNWLSALFGAGVGVLAVPVGVAVQRRVEPRAGHTSRPLARTAVSALLALGFGWSATFRAQALMAEVYTLHLLFLVLLLWLVLARAPLPWFGLVYGLSLAHHRTSVLWALAFFVFLWLDRRDDLRSTRVVTRTLLLLLLPQLLYLYVPLRGPRTSYLHQTLAAGEPLVLYDGSARAFWEHVTGTVFQEQLGAVGPLAERLRLVGRLAAAQLDWSRTAALGLVGSQLVAVALGVLALAGAAWLIRRRSWAVLALLGLGALATAAFGLAYGIGDVEVMFLPLWLVVSLLQQPLLGAVAVRSRLVASATGALLLLLLVGLPLRAWLDGSVPASHTSPVRAGWEKLLAAPPPPDAILVSNDRNEIVPLWYLQFVEGRRRDLLGLFPLITTRSEHADVGAVVSFALATGRPVRLIKPMPGLDLRFELADGEGDLV
ncbi:MAG TPA: DUF2723 domain-containing protein, partial [Ardenticatenaceae bacterium]|nr:DUF2723 domain-containing protein [Ardenticatenaceae bacterium]